MIRYAVVDLSNLFHRARHSTMGDLETMVGMALHIVFKSLRKLHRELSVGHMVFAVDQGSWRTAVYPAYKARRRLDRAQATPREQADNEAFHAALGALVAFLDDRTRCTVLQRDGIEGDDFVARWIDRHPDAEHVIVSGDSDFVQLLAPNVRIYDAINQRTIGVSAVTDADGKALAFSVSPKDGKLKIGKPDPDFVPEEEWWRKALFLKIVRGDAGDSIFSAFPGVRYEGKKHSIAGAWADRYDRGYDWNNLMFQTWEKLVGTSPSGEKLTEQVRVIDEYRTNEGLIDLRKQPVDVVNKMDGAIDAALARPLVQGVGMHFLKFCRQHDLASLEKEADFHVSYLNEGYK